MERPADSQWYKDAVIYEVPVRAFSDSSGDGIGDFKGLTSRLDYLADLGVTALWILPFYPSPLRDDGYDIADYTRVNPDYGTLADVRTFIREAHRRDLRVITELVFNHTSDQHAWFQRARRAAPGSSDRNWYVWSDTPDRYREVRIIFKDFETSNWTWDPVAKAYYWHRFYSHQPDLNFDEPRVQRALLRIVDRWLEAGVDGLRLDAIPYLYERDGTNGENLPETHAFLKRLRSHIDARFADRMLLAEANQWPEDSVAYFGDGDGDECHMSFHFPLMPRMFMALRMEDRFPIIDILAQTPDLPAGGQWALFLRNHDELTLEMVTDEERDYMYRVYAADPQARINLGIRRRLAPLLGNNRRRIELMNGLLFSLPGTPVIYYGDEIGMGDNVYLGDRNGVRTPMQWSSDRNAGFSGADRQRLYLPVVTDPEYHHEAINVEAQQANPTSLLWWMKRVIALRKRHPAFGRGTIRFLAPDNRRILAYIREHGDETLLVVANLSRYAQWTDLALDAYEGRVPIELFGSVEFPRIGHEPYRLSLGPHSFLWFRIASDPLTDELQAAGQSELTEVAWRGDLLGLAKRGDGEISEVLLRWIVQRRWYRGKAHEVRGAKIVAVLPISAIEPKAVLALLQVEYRNVEPATYALPLTTDREFEADRIVAQAPHAAIARLVDESGSTRLLDGALVPGVFEALFAIAAGRRLVRGNGTNLSGSAVRALRSHIRSTAGSLTATPLHVDASNSSALFSDRVILKIYRTLEDGPNPDLEVSRFLAEHNYAHVPAVLGSIEVTRASGPAATLAMVQAFVPNEGNLWDATREAVEVYLQDAPAEAAPPQRQSGAEGLLLELSRSEPPAQAHRLLGASMQTARRLGERLGQMHDVLAAADPRDKAFGPEPLTPFNVRALYQAMRRSVTDSLELLETRLPTLTVRDQAWASLLFAAAPRIYSQVQRLRDVRIDGDLIRVHGDFHLGQVLDTGSDVVIIDFEGEPARPLSSRRLKRPALTDLAGLIRSYHYAAHWTRLERELQGGHDSPAELVAWSTFWHQWVSAACIAGYREATTGASFLPSHDEAWSVLLTSQLITKACYELRYELGSRPDWVAIPIMGLLELAGAQDGPSS